MVYYYYCEIKKNEMSAVCSMHRDLRNVYNILIVKSEQNRPFRKTYAELERKYSN